MAGSSGGDDDPFGDPGDAAPPRKARKPHRTKGDRRPPVRGWTSSSALAGELDGEDEAFPVEKGRPKREPVFWRARDSLYFEPLVALAVIVVLLVSLFAYTSNWPPIYVVESNSMQHGSGDHLGFLNAGDVVLAEKVPNSTIVPWVVGLRTGFQTYGEPGDVLLYHPNGSASSTPIVHRAILYLQYDPANRSYNATQLNGLPCGSGPGTVYDTPGTSHPSLGCGTTGLTGDLILDGLGWRHSINTTIDLSSGSLGTHSGFLTMGDNNSYTDQYRGAAIPPISYLVMPGWIIGVARGMIPWFGALKLALDGNSGLVPGASWELMGITIAAAILAAAGVHWLFRREGIVSPLRRREERSRADEEDEEPEPRSVGSRLRALRPWKEKDDDAPAPRRPASPDEAPKAARRDASRGDRHRLARRRPERPKTDDDDNL